MKGIRRYACMTAAAVLAAMVLGGCENGDGSGKPADDGIVTVLASSQDADGYVYERRSELVYATGDVNIRCAATAQSEIVGVLKAGESIIRTAYNNSWSKVVYENTTCYVSSAYLSEKNPLVKETEEEEPAENADDTTASEEKSEKGETK